MLCACSVLSTSDWQCLMSSITLCDIAHLYLMRCDICRTTLLVLISTETSGDRWTQVSV